MELTTEIDGPVAVIGDVHGHLEKLISILNQLTELPDADQRWIVFIGDLVDRGPDSCGVLELVCELLRTHPKTAVVCGNHDLAMAGALELIQTPANNSWAYRWLDHYQPENTFTSYGVAPDDLDALKYALPEHHQQPVAESSLAGRTSGLSVHSCRAGCELAVAGSIETVEKSRS